MSFRSYAQNFEDVMLWRALRHVQSGFYIDIGAQHPRLDSVSRAFYENGWRGLHVEPVAEYARLLREDRPDESVLEMALGDGSSSEITLYCVTETGLSTTNSALGRGYLTGGQRDVKPVVVPVSSLRAVAKQLPQTEVHWMKIDVEGAEKQVLDGWDSTSLRPWILLIEATEPNSSQPNHQSWDAKVVASGYEFAYFDGLNRFYVASEHAELRDALRIPPNVFDDFELYGVSVWKERFHEAERYAWSLEANIKEIERYAKSLEVELQKRP